MDRSLWRGLHGHQPLEGGWAHSHFIQLAVDYTAPLPLNPICCDKVFSYRDRAEPCYQEKWLIHNPILKCSAFHFTLSDIGGRNSLEINTSAKQPRRRRKAWPKQENCPRLLEGIHSPHHMHTALCDTFCPWIIHELLNRGNGFKTNVAQYHSDYCYCIVLCNFHCLSLSSDLPKGRYLKWQYRASERGHRTDSKGHFNSILHLPVWIFPSPDWYFPIPPTLHKWCLNTQHLGFN